MTKSRARCSVAAVFWIATGLYARPALAGEAATAQALFDQARSLMAEGRFSVACGKLEESQRLDPGGGTLLHLGVCYEGLGRTATAWAYFNEALSAAVRDGRQDRERIARQRIEQLEPKLARLVIRVGVDAPADLQVTRDGVAIAPAQFGSPVPVDPGEHAIAASAQGRARWTHAVVIPSGPATVSIDVPLLAVEASKPEAPREHSVHPARVAAIAAAGLGLVGVGVGTALGLRALDKQGDAEPHCRGDRCDATGVALRAEGMDAGNISTIGFVAGGVLLAAGAVLFFAMPAKKASPTAFFLGSPRVGTVVSW